MGGRWEDGERVCATGDRRRWASTGEERSVATGSQSEFPRAASWVVPWRSVGATARPDTGCATELSDLGLGATLAFGCARLQARPRPRAAGQVGGTQAATRMPDGAARRRGQTAWPVAATRVHARCCLQALETRRSATEKPPGWPYRNGTRSSRLVQSSLPGASISRSIGCRTAMAQSQGFMRPANRPGPKIYAEVVSTRRTGRHAYDMRVR